jgi:hypothetical protein
MLCKSRHAIAAQKSLKNRGVMVLRKMTGSLLLLFSIIFVAWAVVRIVASVHFNVNVDGHLKRAADASSVTMAATELKTSLDYMESHGLTSGYTSIVYRTPNEDIGFWYQNVKSAYQELLALDPNKTTSLEKTNVLMKLRETLLNTKDESITRPDGISIYPYNAGLALWGFLSLLLMVIFGIFYGKFIYDDM